MLKRLWTVCSFLWAALIFGIVMMDPDGAGLHTIVIALGPLIIGLALRRVARFVLYGQ